MSGYYPNSGETNPLQIVRGVRDALDGRSNAYGQFTLRDGETTTTVTAPNCSPDSCISLMPMTATAATAIGAGAVYILAANVTVGQFIVTHNNTADVDRTYRYAIQG
jgi:hypothetical protein